MTTQEELHNSRREKKDAAPKDLSESDSAARPLPAAALRALAEAKERRRAAETAQTPEEIGGRGGLDPARYGDWEVKGLTSDF
jgi:hypothetical protein